MQDTDDAALLRQYVENGSQDAFARLVSRHIDLVYSAARRQVADSDLAADVTQAVFIVLAKKAKSMRGDRSLMAWLLKVTHFAANNARRKRARRIHHENRAAVVMQKQSNTSSAEWEELAPLLDAGIAGLRDRDRDVLVLRYFGQKSNREVAEELGISEEAAQKRTVRAVEKLRDFFRRRGVAVSGVGLTTLLATRSIEAAPAELSAGIASTSVAGAAWATSIAKGAILAMAYAKSKAALVAAVLAMLLIGGGTVAFKAISSARSHAVDLSAPTTVPVVSAKPSPWRVRFSDGTAVDVLAITDKPGVGPWWGPDGSPVPAPSPLPRNILRIAPQQGVRMYQFSIRQSGTDLPNKALNITTSARTVSGAEGGDGGGPASGDRMINVVSAIMDAPTTDVTLQLAAGPWESEERYDLQASATKPTATTQGARSLQIGAIAEKKVGGETQTTITVRRVQPQLWSNREEVIRAIIRDGRSLGSVSNTGRMGGESDYDFPASKDQIVALVFRFRAYETRAIRNISLRPGVKTTPLVSDAVTR